MYEIPMEENGILYIKYEFYTQNILTYNAHHIIIRINIYCVREAAYEQ